MKKLTKINGLNVPVENLVGILTTKQEIEAFNFLVKDQNYFLKDDFILEKFPELNKYRLKKVKNLIDDFLLD